MTDRPPLESPTLQRLQGGLRNRKRAALVPFWNRVASSGTPLVERRKGNRRQSLLTFLWKGRPGTKRVAVRSMAFGLENPETELARLPGSDVWYRSFTVPNDLRALYQFGVDDLTTPIQNWPDWMAREKGWRVDPLNPRRFTCVPDRQFPKDPMNYRTTTFSYVELPRAPRHAEADPQKGVEQGTIQRHRIRSRILGDSRRVWLYLPAGFRDGKRGLHVAIFFDGFWCTTPGYPVATILDNLVAEGRVPPVVGVLVDARRMCTDRWRDMVYRPEPFGRFLVRELLPWVERTLGTRCRPERTALVGWSGGGLSALRYALAYPDHFGLVLSQSGSFWVEDPLRHEPGAVIGAILNQPRPAPLRVYMEAGIYEDRTGGSGVSLLSANRLVRDVLKLKGIRLTYREFTGGHDITCWRQSLVDGLVDIFGNRAG